MDWKKIRQRTGKVRFLQTHKKLEKIEKLMINLLYR